MALRCTVFGHKWGEVGEERERREDGDEVVVTVREVRTCGRCGAEDVLAESMEVTAIDDGDAGQSEPREPPARDPEREDEEAYDAETDDAVILDDDGDDGAGERGPREWPGRPERDDQADDAGEPTPWPETARPDEAGPPEDRFVGAGESPGDREHPPRSAGSDDQRPAAGSDDGRQGGSPADRSDESVDDGAEVVGDEAEVVDIPDAEADAEAGVDRAADDSAAESTPAGDEEPAMGADATRRPEDDAEVLETTEPNEQSRATAREPVDPTDHPEVDHAYDGDATGAGSGGDAESGGGERLDMDDTGDEEPSPEDVEYYCPECGFVDDSDRPSRRAGDVCPDCRRSYLAEREA